MRALTRRESYKSLSACAKSSSLVVRRFKVLFRKAKKNVVSNTSFTGSVTKAEGASAISRGSRHTPERCILIAKGDFTQPITT